VTLRRDLRTAAALVMSAATLVALAASGDTSTNSGGGNSGGAHAKSDSGPNYTPSQQNAIDAAKNYLSTAPFSKKGLIQQLSSSAGDKYPHKDATFAVQHLHVSWKQQAVKAAKNYLDLSSFSCQGLIQQLSSSAGDKYTQAQAQYAANKVGLC
jgi:uncharacterized protein YdeI (BOF family)